MFVRTADTFFIRRTVFLNQQIPVYFRIPLAVMLLILAFYLARTGLRTVFGGVSKETGVIREGVFNIVRHPIYLSEILLYLGFLMLSLSLAALIVWLIACIFLHCISRIEERLLVDRFGDEYSQYMEEVPMWFPRLRRR